MKVFLFRHAESEDNRQHIFSGWRDVPLSEKGRIDAEELAELLKDKDFRLAFAPNLKRNLATIEEVRKYHPGMEIVRDDRIRERSYGDLQGRKHLDLMRENLALYQEYHRAYDFPPPGGESIRMVEERVKSFYADLLGKIREEKVNVAVCAGNNAMRVLRRILEGLNVEAMMKIENPYDNYFEYSLELPRPAG